MSAQLASLPWCCAALSNDGEHNRLPLLEENGRISGLDLGIDVV